MSKNDEDDTWANVDISGWDDYEFTGDEVRRHRNQKAKSLLCPICHEPKASTSPVCSKTACAMTYRDQFSQRAATNSAYGKSPCPVCYRAKRSNEPVCRSPTCQISYAKRQALLEAERRMRIEPKATDIICHGVEVGDSNENPRRK